MNVGRFLLSFRGRIGRRGYWSFVVVVLALLVTAGFVFHAPLLSFHSSFERTAVKGFSGDIDFGPHPWLWLPLIWSTTAVCAKRFHDVGKSAAWALLLWFPMAFNIFIFLVARFSGSSGALAALVILQFVVMTAFALVWIVILVFNGFIAGTPGANRYGEPPTW